MHQKSLYYVTAIGGLFWWSGTFAHAQEIQRIPECGVASVYAVLRSLGRSVDFDELEHEFQKQLRRTDVSTTSLAELKLVVESYGLHTATLRVAQNSIESAPLPAILYLHRSKRKRPTAGIGHFIVVRNASPNQVEIIDLTSSDGWRWIPLLTLQEFWDGELLAVSTRPVSLTSSWLRSAAIACAGTVGALSTLVLACSLVAARFGGNRVNVPRNQSVR